ncbi:hypothetical protein AVEN_19000-1 [Araneus ventricosus]|uniref:Uncharacterized protein n=1 Tax=Araneus ventricosus TaxID=182803 RepID=A0A4Y2DQN2_ARAVE|nr:hypothetical protein AVEN_19000-1 [Araneus ventricosus]
MSRERYRSIPAIEEAVLRTSDDNPATSTRADGRDLGRVQALKPDDYLLPAGTYNRLQQDPTSSQTSYSLMRLIFHCRLCLTPAFLTSRRMIIDMAEDHMLTRKDSLLMFGLALCTAAYSSLTDVVPALWSPSSLQQERQKLPDRYLRPSLDLIQGGQVPWKTSITRLHKNEFLFLGAH